MSAWESFWRSVRRDRGSLILMSQSEWDDAVQRALAKLGITYEELAGMARRDDFTSVEARKLWVSIGGERDQVAELMAEVDVLATELSAERRHSQELTASIAEMVKDQRELRRLLAASPEEAKRVCLDLSDRNAELRAANERLEREVARLQGRSTEQDWTGSGSIALRPT